LAIAFSSTFSQSFIMRMLHTDSVKTRNSLVYHDNVSSSSGSRVVVLAYLQSKVTEGSAYAAVYNFLFRCRFYGTY